MPKWKSPILSDVRGAVGESVVFSQWKGRPYFRSYVKPANPKTCKQRAHRDILKQGVKRYQSLSADPDVKSAWNKRALEYLISGFNLFIKWVRGSEISVSPESFASGTTYPQNVTVHYKTNIPLAEARIYMFDGSTWTDVTPSGGLTTNEGDVTVSIDSAGTYEFYLASNKVLKEGDTGPQPYQAITKWSPDTTNCVAKEAKVEAQ